jgi:N-acylneuraminate cytidylyltransferase/CMP-N,N'-diacetyllegionaminic acid synthase
MFKGRSVLGVIPARGGSKGIPNKNIKLLAGKPLIRYTIDAARNSGVFDSLIISTDSQQIANVAREAGASVPFMRPGELANDTAKGIDVLHHAMDWHEKNNRVYDWIMLLQPTSPLRSVSDISGACDLMLERRAKAVVSVCLTDHHPVFSNTLPADLCMASFLRPDAVNLNRQDLPLYYRLNGAIYLAEWNYIRDHSSWYGPATYAYVMPGERSIDIDRPIDFVFAEALLMTGSSRTD